MASELRVNSSTNRSGLGTITYTDSGPIVSGVGTFANGLTVDGTQTTVKSLKLTGDNYNANWFKTTNKLRFNDNAKATFGTADDLSLYHDGTNSNIANTTNDLNITNTGDDIIITANDDINLKTNAGDNAVNILGGAAVELYHNASKKFETTSSGVTVTGIINGPTQLNLSNNGGDLINLSSSNAAGRSTIKFNTNGNDWEIGARGSTADNPNNFYIFDSATTSYRMLIGSNGYVNIGTGTAEQQLTVQNSAQHSLIRVISKNDSDAGIDFGDTDDTNRAGIRYTNSTDSLSINGNAVTRMKIDSGGRVMIGGGSSPSQVGDGRLIVYSTDRLHPAIKPAGMINNYANGWTLLGDNYQADESQVNLGVSYSSSGLVLSRGVKVSGSADDVYLSSQDSYAMRPSAIKLDYLGAFNFLTTETNATTAVDSAVSLNERFKIDRSGNIYQRPSGRNMYFGDNNALRIGVQSNGDSNIEAQSGDLKFMDSGSTIMQLRSDGLEMKQDIYFGTSGKGIVLGNTSNVDANTLDDYEEGSWTPVVLGWDTFSPYSGSTYYAGWYVKVGHIVHVGWKIYIQNLSTVSSNAHIRISGLPFAAKSIHAGPVGHTRFDIAEFGMSGYQLTYLGGGATTLSMYKHVNGATSLVAINATANRSNIWTMGTATYATDS